MYERLVTSLLADIERGTLRVGQALPAQRTLAHRLGVGIGTVARAYQEAESRGLVTGHVGRGTTVTATPSRYVAPPHLLDPQGPQTPHRTQDDVSVNLSENEPSSALSDAVLSAGLDHPDFRNRLRLETGYAPPAGRVSHRRLLAEWMNDSGVEANWVNTVVCHGAHHGLVLALRSLCKAGDTVLVEGNTYFGFVALMRSLQLQLVPIPMDKEGLRADRLDEIGAVHPGAVLYSMPTLHNPTTRTTSESRRREIVDIARRHELRIIEDDAYRALSHNPPIALVNLAPERTINVVGLSKTIAPSIRTGCLTIPDATLFAAVMRIAQAESLAASSLCMTLAATLLETGLAHTAKRRLVEDTRRRVDLAHKALGSDVGFESALGAHHIWLPMSTSQAERVCFEALRASITLTPPSSVGFDDADSGLRVCTGACDLDELSSSLATIRSLIS